MVTPTPQYTYSAGMHLDSPYMYAQILIPVECRFVSGLMTYVMWDLPDFLLLALPLDFYGFCMTSYTFRIHLHVL
jgi:hypothetical protein